jgi:hypothetical protein
MARAKSAVLSPAEKKAAIKTAKDAVKALNAKIKADNKAHAAVVKAYDKQAAADQKALVKLEAEVASLTGE